MLKKGDDYYYARNGYDKDDKQAVFRYRKSADRGNASAKKKLSESWARQYL